MKGFIGGYTAIYMVLRCDFVLILILDFILALAMFLINKLKCDLMLVIFSVTVMDVSK